jgi:hypothetical protein
VVVPVAPSAEMLDVGETAVDDCEDGTQDSHGPYTTMDDRMAALNAYKAMITAAQQEME